MRIRLRSLMLVVLFAALITALFVQSIQLRQATLRQQLLQAQVEYQRAISQSQQAKLQFMLSAATLLPDPADSVTQRDYDVLEAALNDLTDPKNPEYKYHIKNVGAGREIVLGDKTWEAEDRVDLAEASTNIDNEDRRNIPANLRADLKRRTRGPRQSLADFKPSDSNIVVTDLDKLFEGAEDRLAAFQMEYPTAWGYVWAYPPGYSKEGDRAILVFEGGPNGKHGLRWVYMLIKKGDKWEVEWRHLYLYE